MTKVALAIGCNSYDRMSDLHGAENDAQRVWSCLVDPLIGEHDESRSKLLLSPALSDVRAALRAIVDDGPVEVLTFFFAGHATLSRDSLFLAVKDTSSQSLAVSGFSLSELVQIVAQERPRQTNIIIDACQSAGFGADLHRLLSANTLGAQNTPGVTLVATAAADQFAKEIGGKGIGTNALLKCMTGQTLVSDVHPQLDLVEIGRVMAEELAATSGQTPVVWGLNLSQRDGFCANPIVPMKVGSLKSSDIASEALAELPEELVANVWRSYLEFGTDWQVSSYRALLEQVRAEAGKGAAVDAIVRIHDAFLVRLNSETDPTARLELMATTIVMTLPLLSPENGDEARIRPRIKELFAELGLRLDELCATLRDEGYALNARSGASADFFRLPIRITQVLAWAALPLAASDFYPVSSDDESRFRDLVDLIYDQYPLAIHAVSEEQAPFILAIGAAFLRLEDIDRLEVYTSCWLSSYAMRRGCLARIDLSGEQAFNFTLSSILGEAHLGRDEVAHPSQLLTVLMHLAASAGLTDEMDEILPDVDRKQFYAFVPSTYRDYTLDRIEHGENCTWSVGRDVWKSSEFLDSWAKINHPDPESDVVFLTAIIAAYLLPNRVPWFIWPKP